MLDCPPKVTLRSVLAVIDAPEARCAI
jgi:hypothetical protein